MNMNTTRYFTAGLSDLATPADTLEAAPERAGLSTGNPEHHRLRSEHGVPPLLELDAVRKRYEALVAVDGISLTIRRGEIFGLLGPNGAGKTTLMSLVAGLWPCDEGAVRVDGREVVSGSAEIGFVPQHIALYASLSAEKNLNIFGALYGLRGLELKLRVTEMLEAVQLADRRKDRVGDLSGGMQRRLNLAASLLHRPKLLLCDEPTVGVDPQSRNAIFEFLEERNREGLTIIYSTHYMEEAARLCSRIGIIEHGKILALGTLEELLKLLPFQDEIRFAVEPSTRDFAGVLRAYGKLTVTDTLYRFYPEAGCRLSEFYQLAEAENLHPRMFTFQRPTLEGLFLHLTGRALRE